VRENVIRSLAEFNVYVAISGFKNAKIGDVNNFFIPVRKELSNVVAVQFFDAQLIATWQHLYFAALNALTALENKTNISNNPAMETLLYASAQRQITKATETMGIKSTTKDVAALIITKSQRSAENAIKIVQKLISGEPDDGIIEIDQEKFDKIRRFFHISDKELGAKLQKRGLEKEALVDLVIEHGALLVTQR
jgi:tRNA threonylcarbamoyladenosine modification (KEOPS) complex Cgi121 subunit